MWRVWLAIALALLVAATAVVGSTAALLRVNAGHLAVFTFHVDLGPIAATVDIKPESLQKKSQGQPVMALIELPDGFDVQNIDVGSVRLCLGTEPCADGVAPDGAPGAKPEVSDADGDGIPHLKITFDRGAVIALVVDLTAPSTVTFTVSGIVDPPDRAFAGSDTVRLVDPEPEPSPMPSPSPTATATATATPSPTPTATPTATATSTATATATPTATPTGSAEPTATETPEPPPTGEPDATATEPASAPPEATPTAEPRVTATPTHAETLTPEVTATATATPATEPTVTSDAGR